MARVLIAVGIVIGLGSIQGCNCDNGPAVDIDGGGDGSDQGVVMPSLDGGCTVGGGSCAKGTECCSGSCNSNNLCDAPMCLLAGATCTNSTECCSVNCTNSMCQDTCVSDNEACTVGGPACCSGQCNNGTCTPANPLCKTAGNSCTLDSDCCNHSCLALHCASPSQVSYCTQPGDICTADNQCCTGVCSGAAPGKPGICADLQTGCGVDGTVCNGCTGCCSSLCAPFGISGSKICQPASGCRVLGDLCLKDSDCCGGSVAAGLPGSGLVRCVPVPGFPQIGTCGDPNPNNCTGGAPTCKNTCQPEGDVCHFLGNGGCSSNSFPNDCCGATGNKGACKLDPVGVPRCYGLAACANAGENCASSSDCCNTMPCLPDSTGQLKCGTMCSMSGGVCTTTADCCTGIPCLIPPGELSGTCTPIVTPPPDGGTTDAGTTDGGVPPDMAVQCALYGQACSTTVPCCNGITCARPISTGGALCASGNTDCTCYENIIP